MINYFFYFNTLIYTKQYILSEMDFMEKRKLEYKLKDQLDKQYKKVHIFGVGKDWNDSWKTYSK